MKKLPESELELMMIIWHANKPVTRMEIEKELSEERKIGPTTILSFLSRLQEKEFVKVEKKGKNNLYSSLVNEEEYLQRLSSSILKTVYKNSVKNFVMSLYDGHSMTEKDLMELEAFIEEKKTSR